MGRKPQPTALKILRGNPGKRALPVDEPQPEVAAPPCPAGLTEEAQAEWDRIVPELVGMRVLSRTDMSAVALYCQFWARWREAERKLDGAELVVTVHGQEVPNPHLSIAKNHAQMVQSLGSDLGLNPVARAKTKAAPAVEKKVSKWAGMLPSTGKKA